MFLPYTHLLVYALKSMSEEKKLPVELRSRSVLYVDTEDVRICLGEMIEGAVQDTLIHASGDPRTTELDGSLRICRIKPSDFGTPG